MYKMQNTILAISLMPDHPDYLHRWVVDKNCDAILFGIWESLGKAWYTPIVDGVAKALYWAEQIEKVYYQDLSIVKMEWTDETSGPPPFGYNCRCVTVPINKVPLTDQAWTCNCGSILFLLLRSGEIECSGCHKRQKFKHVR
jgi:hypothetical protein